MDNSGQKGLVLHSHHNQQNINESPDLHINYANNTGRVGGQSTGRDATLASGRFGTKQIPDSSDMQSVEIGSAHI